MAMRVLGWAILVVAADPSLNGFDVLPDVIGWSMVIVALAMLASEHVAQMGQDFRRARDVAIVALVCCLFSTAMFFSEESWHVARPVTEVALAVAAAVVVWWVLLALSSLAVEDRATVFALRRVAVVLLLVLAGRAIGCLVVAACEFAGRADALASLRPVGLVWRWAGTLVGVMVALWLLRLSREAWLVGAPAAEGLEGWPGSLVGADEGGERAGI